MTNKTKHTPGPWAVKTVKWKDYLGYDHAETIIVTAYNHAQIKGPAPVVARWTGLPDKEDGPPRNFIVIEPKDAQLIACAPELLEALEEACEGLQNACEGYNRPHCANNCERINCKRINRFKQLVARAKGGTNS